MPNLLAMCFEGRVAPAFQLQTTTERRPPDGWGVAFYPGPEPAATVLREHTPPGNQGEQIWPHLASSVVVVHLRQARWGALTPANTQPFLRSHAGRDWVFAHAGTLDDPPVGSGGPFEPVGSTDSERVFCWLLNHIARRKWKRIADFDLDVLLRLLREQDARGGLCLTLTDGVDLLAYADAQAEGQLWLWPRFPPYNGRPFGDGDLTVDLFRRGITSQRGLLVCSEPMEQVGGGARWQAMAPGELIVAREGMVRAQAGGRNQAPTRVVSRPRFVEAAEPRTLRVVHKTRYLYETPVERSVHLLRLTPTTDRLQRLLHHELRVSAGPRGAAPEWTSKGTEAGRWRDFDDVFGNRARRLVIEQVWQALVIEAESIVELNDTDPLHYRPLRARTRFPLVWLPSQTQMLMPFLAPPELPESQILTLTDYAMSFVRRNDSDLLETLQDINWTLFREYTYEQGSSTVFTSAWETFVNRRGVCQDFANLFIVLARLLGIPARYVCGYLYLGPGSENRAQAAASHAWVQLFLPELGWTGFDPTNGVLTRTDHVRVAVGRNAVDTTPTSGTLYVGGGAETLEAEVHVELVDSRPKT